MPGPVELAGPAPGFTQSRLKIGLTTLTAAAPERVAALDAIIKLRRCSAHALLRCASKPTHRRLLPARSGTAQSKHPEQSVAGIAII